MLELYVNSDSTSAVDGLSLGSDENNGLTVSTPTLTIAEAIGKNVTGPMTQDVRINLARSVPVYDLANGSLALNDLLQGSYKLEIRPFGWDDDMEADYMKWMDPLGEEYDLGLITFPRVAPLGFVRSLGVLELKGIEVTGDVTPPEGESEPAAAIMAFPGTNIGMKCCRIADNKIGMWLIGANVMMDYCHFENNDLGINLLAGSRLLMMASSTILNSSTIGLAVTAHSTVAIVSAGTDKTSTLVIRTTKPLAEYTAVKAMGHGLIVLDYDFHSATPRMPGFIRILKENIYDHSKHQGVVLDSLSCLLGARNVQFKDPTDVDAVDTIPESRQIVVATVQGAVAVE